ncbi:hypothetical protein DFJ58DRAFT_717310 [Suillus subalutaceus]|uniref:uncharacterized protein n=1 Tax=Suillus subalutaceus TaxID=48586 RepID=UPI001B861D49|nr:uncharacterized protein DFJ58DRAFT_717310 [Suillus subalutaceus]KAG1846560.1 hypothetical protein DFJ58DRAFT_717310 [Suillus subalutaceus]
MREKKIGILCLQEMHLTEEHENQINTLYSRRLRVINSRDRECPGSLAGVAFELAVLNIYTPNNPAEHHNFWTTIKDSETSRNNQQIDLLLGDFNLTEDPLDRAPTRTDNEAATDALRDLRETLNVHDSWRKTHPTSPCTSAIPTDHHMILVRYTPLNMPHIGKGRWSWPLGLVNNEKLLNKMSKLGQMTQRKIETNQQPGGLNPQSEWEDFKIKIRQEAKKTSKEHMYKINTRINQLENDIKLTLRNDDIDTNSNTRSQKAWLESEINHMEKKTIQEPSASIKSEMECRQGKPLASTGVR